MTLSPTSAEPGGMAVGNHEGPMRARSGNAHCTDGDMETVGGKGSARLHAGNYRAGTRVETTGSHPSVLLPTPGPPPQSKLMKAQTTGDQTPWPRPRVTHSRRSVQPMPSSGLQGAGGGSELPSRGSSVAIQQISPRGPVGLRELKEGSPPTTWRPPKATSCYRFI